MTAPVDAPGVTDARSAVFGESYFLTLSILLGVSTFRGISGPLRDVAVVIGSGRVVRA